MFKVQVVYISLLVRVCFHRGSCGNRIGMDGNGISMASELIVGDRELLDKKIAAIRNGGSQKLQVFCCIIFVLFDISLAYCRGFKGD